MAALPDRFLPRAQGIIRSDKNLQTKASPPGEYIGPANLIFSEPLARSKLAGYGSKSVGSLTVTSDESRSRLVLVVNLSS